jgi:hypothetical protein
VEVAASVTPCRHDAGPTMLDEHRDVGARRSAAGLGGDVVGTYEVPMPLKLAVRTIEPAASGFRDPLPADRAGGGSAALIHQDNSNAHHFGLVSKGV